MEVFSLFESVQAHQSALLLAVIISLVAFFAYRLVAYYIINY